MAALRETHSQAGIGQDAWVLEVCPDGHYFIEAGAWDGRQLSNTLVLEQAGWTGICVEPSSEYGSLCANRKCRTDPRCLAAKSGLVVEFRHDPTHGGLSRVVPASGDCRRSTVSLLDLLREHDAPQQIDYFSLDIEAMELEVLEAFDFSTYRFRFMTVEKEHVDAARLRSLLAANGYELVKTVLWEDFYRDSRGGQ